MSNIGILRGQLAIRPARACAPRARIGRYPMFPAPMSDPIRRIWPGPHKSAPWRLAPERLDIVQIRVLRAHSWATLRLRNGPAMDYPLLRHPQGIPLSYPPDTARCYPLCSGDCYYAICGEKDRSEARWKAFWETWPMSAQIWPGFGQIWSGFDRASAEVAQTSAAIAQIWADIGQMKRDVVGQT